MTALTHRDPSTLFNDLVSWVGSVAPSEPQIRIEEYVENDQHVIKADLPGVDPDHDIDVSVDGNVLRLRAQRREEEHDKFRTEIRYGTVERLVTLPHGTTSEQVSASYEHGVLTVTFPTAAEQPATRVPITHVELPAE